jgi:hypothetical protein
VRLDGFHSVAGDDGARGCGLIGRIAQFVPSVALQVSVYSFSVGT